MEMEEVARLHAENVIDMGGTVSAEDSIQTAKWVNKLANMIEHLKEGQQEKLRLVRQKTTRIWGSILLIGLFTVSLALGLTYLIAYNKNQKMVQALAQQQFEAEHGTGVHLNVNDACEFLDHAHRMHIWAFEIEAEMTEFCPSADHHELSWDTARGYCGE